MMPARGVVQSSSVAPSAVCQCPLIHPSAPTPGRGAVWAVSRNASAAPSNLFIFASLFPPAPNLSSSGERSCDRAYAGRGLEPMRQLGAHRPVDYREHEPPPALAGLVKAFWTLDAGGAVGGWVAQQATPDGCVEIIRRLAGRSRWDGDQPERFAVGLIAAPTPFEISGD